MEGLPGFLLAAIALAGSPGPATLSLAAAGAAFGARRVVGYFIGIVVGMVAVMAITASGLVGLLLAVPGATPVVTVAAALYFVWLAWRIATAPPLTEEASQGQPPSFAGGLALSLINPKGYAAMAALFSGFVLLRRPARPRCRAQDRAAHSADHRRQHRLADVGRAADALLPRAAQQSDHQPRLCPAAAGLGAAGYCR